LSNYDGNYYHGTWSYDSKKKLIIITRDKVHHSIIISLREDEFIMLFASKNYTSENAQTLKLVFIPIDM
jgi:hypothetical protein